MSRPQKLEYRCAGCGKVTRLPSSAAGKPIACSGCGLRSRVTGPSGVPTAAATPRASAGTPYRAYGAGPSGPAVALRVVLVAAPCIAGVLLAAGALVHFLGARSGQQGSPTGPAAPQPAATHDRPGAAPDSPPAVNAMVTDPALRIVELRGRMEAEIVPALRPLANQLDRLVAAAEDDPAAERQAALVRLRMYRRVCGVAADDLVLDDGLNEEAVAAAEVCRRLGYLSHEPPNPGLSAEDFAKARRGAQSGNLAFGLRDLPAAVDGWMDDSDADNVATLGHRRWCLNPPLRRIGFGRVDRYSAMWAHDSSGSSELREPAICFPPPGCVPIDLFRPHYAWSVTLDPNAFKTPDAGLVRVRIQRVAPTGMAIDCDTELVSVDTDGYGVGNCIIFRPTLPTTAVGTKYEATIDGIVDRQGRSVRIRYETRFIDSIAAPAPSVSP